MTCLQDAVPKRGTFFGLLRGDFSDVLYEAVLEEKKDPDIFQLDLVRKDGIISANENHAPRLCFKALYI